MSTIFNFLKSSLWYFVLPACLSVAFVPLVKKFGLDLEIYAEENKRTVHHGKIVRIGGVAIFLAFNIALAYFFRADQTINGVMLGGIIVFITGLVDDMIDLKPKVKLLFQCLAAVVAMAVGGISLEAIYLPLGITIKLGAVNLLITFFWLIGVTNAINLIDGLDGLSSGICMIVLFTISIIAYQMMRIDIWMMSIILAGSIVGFWIFNFHPASIFMGDCGALYLGFMIACFSLMGFKTATVITLGFPIMVLFVPISDTLIAIVRRKLRGEKFDVADRGHMHHVLMYRLNLGHLKAVLVLYVVTFLFSVDALITYKNEKLGMILLIILLFFFDLFIEFTGMVNGKYHPLLTLAHKVFGWPKIVSLADAVTEEVTEETKEETAEEMPEETKAEE